MKRIVFAGLLAVLLLAGCVSAGRTTVVAKVPVPAPLVVAHGHGHDCSHFWGLWEGRPVYLDRGVYSYWNGAAWVERTRPPVVYRTRVHHPDARYHYYSRGSVPPASPSRPHEAAPARRDRDRGRDDARQPQDGRHQAKVAL